MNEIFEKNKKTLIHLQTDNGGEFHNKIFKNLMAKNNIKFYSTYSTLKASVVERFNRTLKNKMWEKFSLQGSYKWMNILDTLVNEYNRTRHRTIKMAPNDVNSDNEKFLLRTVYNRPTILSKNKFSIGDIVRISKYKTIFEKGYTPNYTTELFKVINVNRKFPVTYKLEDMKRAPIAGQFYEQKLQNNKLSKFIFGRKSFEM